MTLFLTPSVEGFKTIKYFRIMKINTPGMNLFDFYVNLFDLYLAFFCDTLEIFWESFLKQKYVKWKTVGFFTGKKLAFPFKRLPILMWCCTQNTKTCSKSYEDDAWQKKTCGKILKKTLELRLSTFKYTYCWA